MKLHNKIMPANCNYNSYNDASTESNIFNSNKASPRQLFTMRKISKTVDAMEKIKSKIELFNMNDQAQLLPAILRTYGQMICDESTIANNDSNQIALSNFEKQVTQNQNGIFLNLTNCSDELWQSCVYCVEQIERQNSNLDMLDKERQTEMEKIRNTQLTNN